MTKINTRIQYCPAFLQFIEHYKHELENTKPVNVIDSPFLKNVYHLSSGMKGLIFERIENQGYSADSSRVLDAYKWEGNIAFSVMMKAKDGRAKRYDAMRNTFKSSYIMLMRNKKRVIAHPHWISCQGG